MEIKHIFLTFELIADERYPITVTLPDSTVKEGVVICKDNIISQGSTRLYPGMVDIEIEDLTYIDEMDETTSHDFSVEMICYAINEGSVQQDTFDSGLTFKLANPPHLENIPTS